MRKWLPLIGALVLTVALSSRVHAALPLGGGPYGPSIPQVVSYLILIPILTFVCFYAMAKWKKIYFPKSSFLIALIAPVAGFLLTVLSFFVLLSVFSLISALLDMPLLAYLPFASALFAYFIFFVVGTSIIYKEHIGQTRELLLISLMCAAASVVIISFVLMIVPGPVGCVDECKNNLPELTFPYCTRLGETVSNAGAYCAFKCDGRHGLSHSLSFGYAGECKRESVPDVPRLQDCEELVTPIKKAFCYQTLAVQQSDPSICDLIDDREGKEKADCYEWASSSKAP